MTTIAFKAGVMSCDTRIVGNYLSTIPSKIIKDKHIVGFCGDAMAGYCGAQYLAQKTQDRPEVCSEDDCMYLLWDGRNLSILDTNFRSMPVNMKFYAIGSGAMAAMAAMEMGASAPEAVKLAIKYDENSGGRVLSFKLD